jgi:ferrous iron transport protein A
MAPVLPLLMIPEGKQVRVFGVNAGRGLSRRLIEMGFTKDALVEMIKSDRGSLIVDVNGCKYALSKGIAMKIMVTNSRTENKR